MRDLELHQKLRLKYQTSNVLKLSSRLHNDYSIFQDKKTQKFEILSIMKKVVQEEYDF